MPFCPKCGYKLETGDDFCFSCGYNVSSRKHAIKVENEDSEGRDELFAEAGRCIIHADRASIGYLQRMLKLSFTRASRIMDQLTEEGVVGPESGTKARDILMTIEEFEAFLDS